MVERITHLAQQLMRYWHSVNQPKYLVFLAIAIIGLAAMTAGALTTYQTYFEQPPHTFVPTDENWKLHLRSLVDLARQNVEKDSLLASGSATVEVAGAVSRPGVYQVNAGARWQEAVLAAGGFAPGASQRYIHQNLNLAEVIHDGEKLYVPLAAEDDSAQRSPAESPDTTRQSQSPTNETEWLAFFNTATINELDSLPGIGLARAKAIAQARPFTQLSDLATKTKIALSTLEAIWKGESNNNE